MGRPVVALLTDFGTSNHYAGAMKGVVLGVCPDVTLVDIAHDLPPHDVLAGALELAACYRYFPPGTIFLVVVDPGVGSARRGLAVEAGEYRFVGPDNGVLSLALRETPPRRVVELTERKYARPTISRTFEGRDRFAPSAGWLAKGVPVTALGRLVRDYLQLDLAAPAVTDDAASTGVILTIDRFGNAITNIDRQDLRPAVERPVQHRRWRPRRPATRRHLRRGGRGRGRARCSEARTTSRLRCAAAAPRCGSG